MTFYEEMIQDKKKHHDRFWFIILFGIIFIGLNFVFCNILTILSVVITFFYFIYTCYNVWNYDKEWELRMYRYFFKELNIDSIEMMDVEQNKVIVYKDLYKYDSVTGHLWIIIKNAIEIKIDETPPGWYNIDNIPHALTITCRRPDVFNLDKIFWLRVNFNNGVTFKINLSKYMRKYNYCAYYGNFLKEATI